MLDNDLNTLLRKLLVKVKAQMVTTEWSFIVKESVDLKIFGN